jgi:uncharacterized protein YlzI (FlbEa/FlbD family)
MKIKTVIKLKPMNSKEIKLINSNKIKVIQKITDIQIKLINLKKITIFK